MTDSPFLHWPDARYTQGEARRRRERERLRARRADRMRIASVIAKIVLALSLAAMAWRGLGHG